MNLAELFADERVRQAEFPVTRDKVFLAHAGVSPLPRRVAEAISRYVAASTQGDQESMLSDSVIRQTRELAARLIGSRPEEIALVGPTSMGLSVVANGLRFRKNDNILIYFDDYPSNVYPWMTLADQGVEVRFLNPRELGGIRLQDVAAQVDEQTRMVALASCHFVSGYRLDLNPIGRFLHQRGILFCVDGIQTLGAFPTPVENVDFLAADAHKWMLGPCGAGILYVRQALQERLRPTTYGWHNLHCPNFVAQEDLVFRNDARRYEAGTHNLLGMVGLKAALELLLETGIDRIAEELLRKRAWLVPALQAKGYRVLHADVPPEHASGIISFHRDGTDLAALHQRLEQAGVLTSLRADRSGRKHLRLSPHFYNTDTELQRVLELV